MENKQGYGAFSSQQQVRPPMHRPHTDPSTLHRLVPILFKNLHPKMNASSKRNMLKVLRLVSKDVGSLALSVMHRCEVYIGETEGFFPISPQPEMAAVKTTASPDPQQLSKLMAGNHLRELKVFIIVKTGLSCATVSQQLTACVHQMDYLVSHMRAALNSVTHLMLSLLPLETHRVYQASVPVALVAGVRFEAQAGPEHNVKWHKGDSGLKGCNNLSGKVFGMLAACLPKLRKLCLKGHINNLALHAFGTSCPDLHSLEVTVPSVAVTALKRIDMNLPNLRCVTFRYKTDDWADRQELGSWISGAFQEFKRCKHLKSVDVDFTAMSQDLECAPECWQQLPLSLQFLRVACPMESCAEFKTLISRLPSLCLQVSPCDNLLDLLQEYPHLEHLQITGEDEDYPEEPQVWVPCSNASNPVRLAQLKEHVLGRNLLLNCGCIGFIGSSTEVREVISWYPESRLTSCVAVQLAGDQHVPCLQQLARVFPVVCGFYLQGSPTWTQEWAMDMEFFRPLVSCKELEMLQLSCPHLKITTAGLLQLCSMLVNLDRIFYLPCKDVDLDDLEAGLENLGRNVTVFEL